MCQGRPGKQRAGIFSVAFCTAETKNRKNFKEARRRKRLRAKAGRSLLLLEIQRKYIIEGRKNNKNSEVSPEIWGKTVFIEIFWKKGEKFLLRNLRFCTIIYSVKLYGYGKEGSAVEKSASV